MSFTEIGEKVGMTRVGVKKRVKQLEELGIIRGSKAAIHREGSVKMYMEITTVEEDAEDVLAYLDRTGYVTELNFMTGKNRIHATAVAPDISELKYLAKMLVKTFPDTIKHVECRAVKEVIKTNNGFVYVISDMISTPTSLYDFINNLDDNYSLFKDMVLSSGERIFDKANSKAIGVNNEGNTVYDSVFIYKNSFFEAKGFDMNSESLTATMLLFSNDVINEAMNDAKQRLASWGLERNQDTLRHWILKAAFFNKKYEADEIQTTDTNDLQSIYGMQWRTNVQKVDVANPTELSNGVVYKVKKLHLPTNLLIYRLKDYFYYYENCTDEEKDSYFKTFNMTYNGCKTEVAEWTPWAGVWPLYENRILRYDKTEGVDDSQGFQIDFTPIMLSANGDVTPYKIPPGTYRLAMGFVQNMGVDIKVEVLVNGKIIATSPSITLGSATTYHYDRGAVLDNRYPEGFEPNYVRSKSGNKKAANYDTDGGPIISELNIPDVKGDGSASTITLRIVSDNWGGKTMVKLHHWCLRPTSNNY
jgi:DNA-binding Lrp family transcriptional regulator